MVLCGLSSRGLMYFDRPPKQFVCPHLFKNLYTLPHIPLSIHWSICTSVHCYVWFILPLEPPYNYITISGGHCGAHKSLKRPITITVTISAHKQTNNFWGGINNSYGYVCLSGRLSVRPSVLLCVFGEYRLEKIRIKWP